MDKQQETTIITKSNFLKRKQSSMSRFKEEPTPRDGYPRYFVFCGPRSLHTASLIIPWDLLTEKRKQQINAIQEECIELHGVPTYLNKLEWDKSTNTTTYLNREPIFWLYQYAGIDLADTYVDSKDKIWFDQTWCDTWDGNYVKNYKKLISKKEWKGKPFECVSSLLVLEEVNVGAK